VDPIFDWVDLAGLGILALAGIISSGLALWWWPGDPDENNAGDDKPT